MLHISIFIIHTLLLSLNADLIAIRGFKDVDILVGKEFQDTDLASLTADNTQQCTRLCWLYSNCTMVTFHPRSLRCRLANPLVSTNLSLSLVTNDETITVDLRLTTIDKVKYVTSCSMDRIISKNSLFYVIGVNDYGEINVKAVCTCDEPRLHGCDHRPCQSDELCVPVMDPDSYKCLPLGYKKCPPPPSIPDSAPAMTGLSEVSYACSDGYVRSGSNDVSSCDQTRGQWSPVDVTCTYTDCGSPPRVDGASSKGNDTSYNARVVYTCFDGHVSNSSSMLITCQEDGQWTSPPDRCTLVTCPQPTNVMNGDVRVLESIRVNPPPDWTVNDLDVVYGDSAIHSCKEGFESPTRPDFRSECQEDGTWESPSAFTCNPVDCGRPPAIVNTWSAFNSTTFQSQVAYKCVEGYENASESSMDLTCIANGTWSGDRVTCRVVDCGTPPEEKHALVAYGKTTYLSEANYSCNGSAYMHPGPVQTRSCRATGMWSDEPVMCIACGQPRDFPHTFFNISSLEEDYYVAAHYCEEGFVLNGGNIDHVRHMCLPGLSEWMGIDASCEMVSCGNPPEIGNATVLTSNGTFFESVATYSCNEGFAHAPTPNTTSLICEADGVWGGNSSEINCMQIFCEPPPVFNNSFYEIVDNKGFSNAKPVPNSAAVYHCKGGFVLMNDTSTKRCLLEGIWDDTLIRCEQANCHGKPKSLPNARLSVEETDTGPQAIYECLDGYRLANESRNNNNTIIITCVDGNWTNFENESNNTTTMACLAIDCGTPPDISGSRRDFNGTLYGEQVVYTDTDGRSWTSTCQQDGVWSSRNDSNNNSSSPCQDCGCAHPPDVPHATIITLPSSTTSTPTTPSLPGPMAPGYVGKDSISNNNNINNVEESGSGSGDGGSLSTITTTISSKADFSSTSVGDGARLTTASPSAAVFGVYDYNPGDIVTYQCDVGHHTVDNRSSFVYGCTSGGEWQIQTGITTDVYDDNAEPGTWIGQFEGEECILVDCGAPPTDPFSTPDFINTTYGSVVSYGCHVGYGPVQNGTKSCSENGTWVGDESFHCYLDGKCNATKELRHGDFIVYGDYSVGTVVSYSCDNGHELRRNISNMTCMQDYTWSNYDAVACLRLKCGSVPVSLNTSYNLYEVEGVLHAKYSCVPGYMKVEGNQSLTCGGKKQWEGTALRCDVDPCSEPSVVEHATAQLSSKNDGSNTVYVCDEGYEHWWFESRSCSRHVGWSAERVQCNTTDCGPPPDYPNASKSVEDTTYLSEVLYTCDEGYRFTTTTTKKVCTESGNWSSGLIECTAQLLTCPVPPSLPHSTMSHGSLTATMPVATYVCEPGYTKHFPSFDIFCTFFVWRNAIQHLGCDPVTCASPPEVDNAAFAHNIISDTFESEISYRCDEGYQMAGPGSKVCQADGTWSPEVTECFNSALIFCQEPPSTVENAIVTVLSYVRKAVYTCLPGYSGGGVIHCLEGAWTSTRQIKCQPVDCGTPTTLLNAKVTVHQTTYAERAVYECLDDPDNSRPKVSICTAQGTWSPLGNWSFTPSPCLNADVLPCPLPIPEIGNSTSSIKVTHGLYYIVYHCYAGYTSTVSQPTFSSYCVSGQWTTNMVFACVHAGDCSDIPVLENANFETLRKGIQGSDGPFFTAKYKCHERYRPREWDPVDNDVDVVSVGCYPASGWGPLPDCDVIDCGPFPASNDSTNPFRAVKLIETTYLTETLVACQPPYLGPSHRSVCQKNGTWSSVYMSCREFYCNVPPSFPDGSLAATALHKLEPSQDSSSWVIKCNANFQYLGTGEPVTCQLNTDDFSEEWRGLNESFCVQSKWVSQRIPFITRIHWDKVRFFDKITVCFDGIYIGNSRETPFMSFTDQSASSPSYVRIRLNAEQGMAYLGHTLNNGHNELQVAKMVYSFGAQDVLKVCGVIHIHNSTFVASVDNTFMGSLSYLVLGSLNETLGWAEYVVMDQNLLINTVDVLYGTDLQDLTTTTADTESVLGWGNDAVATSANTRL